MRGNEQQEDANNFWQHSPASCGSVWVIGFFTALLIFTADHSHKDIDLLDVMIDYVQSQTQEK